MTIYASEERLLGCCDVCGFRHKLSKLRELVRDERPTGIRACPACWVPDHPQYKLKYLRPTDPYPARDPRPCPDIVSLFGWNPAQSFEAVGYLGSVRPAVGAPPPAPAETTIVDTYTVAFSESTQRAYFTLYSDGSSLTGNGGFVLPDPGYGTGELYVRRRSVSTSPGASHARNPNGFTGWVQGAAGSQDNAWLLLPSSIGIAATTAGVYTAVFYLDVATAQDENSIVKTFHATLTLTITE